MPPFSEPYALVDLETTGTNPLYDRITEIAIVYFSAQGERQVWQSLIDPQRGISDQIVALTGITNDMVREAPPFCDVAEELEQILESRILVAHNVRFDYGFLKNAFKREGVSYRPKVICSVKLSRALYPEERLHNLNVICQRHAIKRDVAHRALADTEALEKMLACFIADKGHSEFQQAVKKQLAKPALPMHLDAAQLDSIPRSAGVYRFYGEGGSLLYVGKSVNLHARVLSHFSADHSNGQDMKIVQSVRTLEWQRTGGDLGAQLLEAKQIKSLVPILNRRQRRHKRLFCFSLIQNSKGYLVPQLAERSTEDCYWSENFYGLYRNRSAAQRALINLADNHGLCKKLLGIEKGAGACFGYQLKKCKGGCLDEEPAERYNLRLEMAFLELRVNVWPYPGPVVVHENDAEDGTSYFHLIHHFLAFLF